MASAVNYQGPWMYNWQIVLPGYMQQNHQPCFNILVLMAAANVID